MFLVVCVCIESITLSGDERDLEPGKVCVHLKYEEAVEQVWITLEKVWFQPGEALLVYNRPLCPI